LKIRNGRLKSFSALPTHPAIINFSQPPFTIIRIKAECKVLSIHADIMQEIMTLLPNTQPKQLEQQNNRLKEATVKVYYTDGRDNIDQKA